MKRFVVGDIHGGHKALVQCLERSRFDKDKDLLISLGDICDGWPEVNKVVDEFLKIKNMKMVLSNHDAWALRWMQTGWQGYEWVSQGGDATLESYNHNWERVPKAHTEFFKNAPLYMELDNKLFVHGGFDPEISMNEQDPEVLLWDRSLVNDAMTTAKEDPAHRYGKWKDIFVGHTTTEWFKISEPIHACNVWMLDTGGGWSGRLTIMDIDSYQFWQSDPVPDLYPGIPGRR